MAKKKAAQRKTTASKDQSSNVPKLLPPMLLEGQTVVLSAEYRWHGGHSQLAALLRKEGASVSKSVTAQTDVLLFNSSMPDSALEMAEQLNDSGASIRIIESLSELIEFPEDSLAGILRSPLELARFVELDRQGMLPYFHLPLADEVFGGLELAGQQDAQLHLDSIDYRDCTFTDSTFHHVRLGTGSGMQSMWSTRFERCRMDDVDLPNGTQLVLVDVTGTRLFIGETEGGQYCRVRLDALRLKDQHSVSIQDCEFRQVGQHLDHPHLVHCSVSRSTFGSLNLRSLTAHYCELTDVSFIGGDASEIVFDNCTLKNVVFEDLQFRRMHLHDCVLSNVTFRNCRGRFMDFGTSRTKQVSAEQTSLTSWRASDQQLQNIVGLESEQRIRSASMCASALQLSAVFQQSERLSFLLQGTRADGVSVQLKGELESRHRFRSLRLGFHSEEEDGFYGQVNADANSTTGENLAALLLQIVAETELCEVDTSGLKVSTKKCPLKANELKRLIINAVREGMGQEAQTSDDHRKSQKQARTEVTALRKEMLAELQAGDVKAFNSRSVSERKKVAHFRKARLSGLNLKGVDLSELDLSGSDLSGADLTQASLKDTRLRNADLSEANLSKAVLDDTNLGQANLSEACFKGASLEGVNLKEATLTGARWERVKVTGFQDLGGVDLSQVTVVRSKLDHCSYNEKTILPPGLDTAVLREMHWYGRGLPPHERVQNEQVSGPLTFDQFMERLNEITDAKRLKKALKMLKEDSFQLFSEIADTSVTGVVRSQTDPDLVYACTLDDEGGFACCTQNLRPCGGLRGALCKHLLVLIVGLTQSGELNASVMDEWINSSKLRDPELDKDQMSEVLLKHKGAEAGEIDWRPTETVPEDFFAF